VQTLSALGRSDGCEDLRYELKAAFGRGRLRAARFARRARRPTPAHDAEESSTHDCDELLAESG
jgi:hypothetical protein